MSERINPPLKWHGGKHYMAPDIIKLMPPRCAKPNNPDASDAGWLHYVEPFFGGGAVLLANDPEGVSEVANDLNGELTNFWEVLQDDHEFGDFRRQCESTPFSREEFELAVDKAPFAGSPVQKALWFFIRCRQSLSGRMKGFTGITRNRTRRGMNAEVSAWLTTVEGLPAVHERLKRVLILNKDALDVIASEDGPRTLFYLDPPYLHSTRSTTGEYAHEMTEKDHTHLLMACTDIKGRFLLSGYRSELYDDFAKTYRWRRVDFDLPNNAAGGESKRRMVECVWMNY